MRAKIFIILTTISLIFMQIHSGFAGKYNNKVGKFTLPDYNGTKHSLSDYQDAEGILLLFISTQCPVSNAYNERMVELYNDYKAKGIVFLAINSNKKEDIKKIKKHAKKYNFSFPVLKDENNIIADQLEASVTPEVYLLNPDLEILYHGRIDDSRREKSVSKQDLRNALNNYLAGKEISPKDTKAFGCTIKRVD